MSEPAVPDLELLQSFVNTFDLDTQLDELDTPERLRDWLVAQSLLAADETIDDRGHSETLEFREAIRALALANGAIPLDPAAIATLNRFGAEASLGVHLDPDGQVDLRVLGEGIQRTFGQLFSILYASMVDGSFRRLKGCANDTCQWMFLDQSKNRSKKWCEMESCGNVINARAYRQRHHHEAPEPCDQDES
ncbi:MAG: CGNR zinc finger domain-containing protein [Actinomycetia bacterium]|nr:CGNR zinc finger domain-containing protein [Actinomycetes bacterium]MCP5030684.1 CGNR zinc finger domain-containing protein [Actinomycetes bacterium]